MKFSHSIQFNAVPDWSSRYISYSNLKKLIYQLEKQLNQANGASAGRKHDDAESSPLLSQSTSWSDNPDQVFAKKLEEELEKVCSFFQLKELEIYGEVDAILKDVEEFEAEHAAGEREGEGHGVRRQSLWARARQQSIFKNFQLPQPRRRRSSTMGTQRTNDSRPRDTEDIQEGDESEEEDAGEGTALTKGHAPDLRTGKWESGKNLGWSTAQHDRRTSVDQNSSAEVRRRPSMAFNDFGDDALQALYDEGITLKKRIVNLYVDVSELRSFVQLNEKGFSKVLKKYDKVLDRNLKSSWIDAHVKPAIIFQSSTMEHMSEHLSRLEQGYASIVTSGDVEAARRALRLHLREHVVWERNTVWREMIGIERKAQAANLGIRQTMLGQDTDPKKARLQGDEEDGHATKEVQTLVGRYRCPKFLLSGTFWVLVAYCAIFAVLLGVRFMDAPEQQNCLALIVFVSSLWATEVSHSTCVVGVWTAIRSAICSTFDLTTILPTSFSDSTLSHIISRLISCIGYSSVRHIPPRAIPGSHPPRRPPRRETACPPRKQSRCDLHLCRHVDARHHVTPRRLHYRGGSEQVQHRQDDGDLRSLESGNEAKDSAVDSHGRRNVRFDVDI